MRELHNEKLNLFRETAAIESAIKSQIVAAIDPIYLKEFKNSTTATIKHTISQILTYRFQRYGQVPYHRLLKEKKVQNFVYSTSDPNIVIFNAIEELSNLSKAAKLEKSQQQIINYGLEILRQYGEFKTSMATWFNKPHTDLTWSNFKKLLLMCIQV